MTYDAASLNIDSALGGESKWDQSAGLNVLSAVQLPQTYHPNADKPGQTVAAKSVFGPFSNLDGENLLEAAYLPERFTQDASAEPSPVDWDSLFGQRSSSPADEAVATTMQMQSTLSADSHHSQAGSDTLYLEAMSGNASASSLNLSPLQDVSSLKFEYLVI